MVSAALRQQCGVITGYLSKLQHNIRYGKTPEEMKQRYLKLIYNCHVFKSKIELALQDAKEETKEQILAWSNAKLDDIEETKSDIDKYMSSILDDDQDCIETVLDLTHMTESHWSIPTISQAVSIRSQARGELADEKAKIAVSQHFEAQKRKIEEEEKQIKGRREEAAC